ncbi:MAG TPA: acyl carrier protein [Microvirga sp.]|jgi:acyl carrier protein
MDNRLLGVLAEVLGLRVSDIRIDMTKEDIENWDSLKQMDLIMSIEREYNIELELADILRMNTIVNIATVLREKGIDVAG